MSKKSLEGIFFIPKFEGIFSSPPTFFGYASYSSSSQINLANQPCPLNSQPDLASIFVSKKLPGRCSRCSNCRSWGRPSLAGWGIFRGRYLGDGKGIPGHDSKLPSFFLVPKKSHRSFGCQIEIDPNISFGWIKIPLLKEQQTFIGLPKFASWKWAKPSTCRCLVICNVKASRKHHWGQSLALHHLWQWEGNFHSASGCRCGILWWFWQKNAVIVFGTLKWYKY